MHDNYYFVSKSCTIFIQHENIGNYLTDYLLSIASFIRCIFVLCIFAAFPSPANLALNKTTSSSGQQSLGSSPSVVVDGDKSDSFTKFSTGKTCTQCFLSIPSVNPWWRVDLEGQFYITYINIYTGMLHILYKIYKITVVHAILMWCQCCK